MVSEQETPARHCVLQRISLLNLRERCPLDNSRHLVQPESLSLGFFDLLPSEIFFKVLADLDLVSLTTLRRVNRLAMSIVDQAPDYAYIVANYPDVLRAVLVTRAQAYSCGFLCSELKRSRCRACNADEIDIYLITGVAVCRACQLTGYRTYKYSPLTWPHIRLIAETTETSLDALGDCPWIIGLRVRHVQHILGRSRLPESTPPRLYDGEEVVKRIISQSEFAGILSPRDLYFRTAFPNRRRQAIIACRRASVAGTTVTTEAGVE